MTIGPSGGRLMRAAVCGLLAAIVLPAIASADTTVAVNRMFPFSEPGCTEPVTGFAVERVVTVLKDDGSTHVTTSIQSIDVTGTISGARYTASMMDLFTFQLGPGLVLEKDVITKVTRVGELTVGGISVPDDMIMKFHIHTTITPNLDVASSFSHPVFHCN
jgi:hypothetical protein